jgi:RimJ/RimL family protein N-acetyltransferase
MNKAIRILQVGDEEKLEAFLRPRIASSMFLSGNLRTAGLADDGHRLQGTYVAAWQGDEIVGVVAHYRNGNLIMQAPVALLDELCLTAVSTTKRPFRSLVGPWPQVQAVKATLDIQPAMIQMEEPEKLYRLSLADLIVPPPLPDGRWQWRRLQADDVELMIRWRTDYILETKTEADSPTLHQRVRAGVERYQQQGVTWLLLAEGKPVASSSFNSRTAEAVQIGGVWTPPEWRGRGYGRGVVAASLLDAREEGVETAVLFTGEENIPAQKAYEALGFVHIGDYCILLLREPLSAVTMLAQSRRSE